MSHREQPIGRLVECKQLHTYNDKFNKVNNQFYTACERGDLVAEEMAFFEYMKTSSHRKKVTNKER